MRTGLVVLIVTCSNRNQSGVEGHGITACLSPSATLYLSHSRAGGFLCRRNHSAAPGGPLFNFAVAECDQLCGEVKKLYSFFDQTCLNFYFPFSSESPGDTRRSPSKGPPMGCSSGQRGQGVSANASKTEQEEHQPGKDLSVSQTNAYIFHCISLSSSH